MEGISQLGGGMIYFLLIIGIFFFFIIRPQQKRQKERASLLDALKKGDEVITVGGVHGTITSIKDDNKLLVLRVDDNVKLNVDRSAISHMKGQEAPPAK